MSVSTFDARTTRQDGALSLLAYMLIARIIDMEPPSPGRSTLHNSRTITSCIACQRQMMGKRAGSLCAACRDERTRTRKRDDRLRRQGRSAA